MGLHSSVLTELFSTATRCIIHYYDLFDLHVAMRRSNFLSFFFVALRKLYEDQEGGVFSVTLFKKNLSEFKAKAQQNK